MSEDSTLSRLKKLKALAERGIGGEKENAQMLLDKLCEKYGISSNDVESSDAKTLRWFRFKKGPQFRKLLGQCIFKTVGKGRATYKHSHSRVRELGVECTAAEGMEIELDYAFYAGALKVEMTRLIEMFIQRNDLFPPNTEVSKDCKGLSPEDLQLLRGLKKHTRVLQIGSDGKDNVDVYDPDEEDDDEE